MKKKLYKYDMQHFGRVLRAEGSDYEDACKRMLDRGEHILKIPFIENLLGDEYRWNLFLRNEKATA